MICLSQAKPQKIRYRLTACDNQLEVHADSAFAEQTNRKYAPEGTNVMRRGTKTSSHGVVHQLLEGTVQSHRTVIMSTFVSEEATVSSAVDISMLLIILLLECKCEPLAISEAKRL